MCGKVWAVIGGLPPNSNPRATISERTDDRSVERMASGLAATLRSSCAILSTPFLLSIAAGGSISFTNGLLWGLCDARLLSCPL